MTPGRGRGSRRAVPGFCCPCACLFGWLVSAALAMFPASAPAVDRALVPLENESWALRLSDAIESMESGRLRQGVETFHAALTGPERHHLIRVPTERPYDLVELKSLLKEAGDPVTAVGTASSRPGRRFLPVAEVAHLALTLLPDQVLLLYRSLFDGYAASLVTQYEQDGNSRHLEELSASYFFTSRGAWATELLGDSRLAAGLSRRAIALWRRVLRVSNDTPTRTRLRLKVLRTLRELGDLRQYAIEKRRVLALARPGGDRESLERAVTELERLRVTRREPLVPQSRWGGELPERNPVLAGLKYQRSWSTGHWAWEGLPVLPLAAQRLFFGLRHRPFVPLWDGTDLYMSGVFGLFRFDGSHGHGRMEFEHPKPSSPFLRGLAGGDPYQERSDSVLFTTTLWKKPAVGHADRGAFSAAWPERVLIAQYVSDRVLPTQYMQYDITVEIPIRSLIVYDRDRTAPLWKTGQRNRLPTRFASAVQKDFSYTSPVVVKDGLVVAGGWIQRGFVDSLLRAHDLQTGALVWETFLSGDQNEGTMFGEMAREPYSGAILEHDNTIYYCTQFGAVGAVRVSDGTVRWLTTYDTIEVHATRSRQALKREAYWDANPLLLAGHVLIVTPRDSEYLLAVDTGHGPDGDVRRGQVLWRYRNADGLIRSLLGLRDGHLCFTGPEGIGFLDVRGLPGFGGGVAPIPEQPFLRYQAFRPTRDIGPGALSAEGVVFADRRGLRLFVPRIEQGPGSADGGEVEGDLPGELRTLASFRRRGAVVLPGRVQITEGVILVTAGRVLDAYSPSGQIPAR